MFETEQYFSKEKQEMWFNFIVGGAIAAAGLLLPLLSGASGGMNKVLVGLSLIPLSIGLGSAVKIAMLRQNPGELKAMIASLTDERLVGLRNEAEATSNRWLRWLTRLAFFGYTFSLPDEVFVSPGWWIIFCLFCLSYILPTALLAWSSRGTREA